MSEEKEKDNIDEDEVYEPGSTEELISYLKRNFNTLNENNIVQRKKAITNIYERLSQEKFKISGMVSQQIVLKFHKQLLKAFSDKSEKVREFSIKITRELITRCEDMTQFLPYIFSVVTERVNCTDLEGILQLPEVMRPPPSQKPKRLIKLVEECEELRIELSNLMMDIVCCAESKQLYDHLDDICNIIRALTMDPCSDIQRTACQVVSQFCRNNREILLHFSEILSRGLLLPLISKKSKVRIAALEALGQVLYCGVWKYNAIIFEILIGFRDPNSVPIKDFYEPSHNINYFATLITDPKVQVREMFLRCAGEWVCYLPDRYDHHPRLIPYLLSGLFDQLPEIRQTCLEVLEELGQIEEKEREKEFREQKQYGMDCEWTCEGKLIDLPLPSPFQKRPCLGARIIVRSHVRKFWNALYKEIKDPSIDSKIRSANLFLMSVVYSEDYMTQFLDHFVRNLIWQTSPKNKEEWPMADKIQQVFHLLGRFCPYTAYFHLISSGLKGEFSQNDEYVKCSLQALACLIKGSLEAIPAGSQLEVSKNNNKKEFIENVIDLISDKVLLDQLAYFNHEELNQLMENLITGIYTKASNSEIQDLVSQKRILKLLQILFIQIYINYYEKSIILNINFTKDKLIAFSSQLDQQNPIFKQITSILKTKDLQSDIIIKNFVNEIAQNIASVTIIDNSWKLLIGILSYLMFFEENYKLNDQIFDILSQSIQTNNNPEITDFIAKLCMILAHKVHKDYHKNTTNNDSFECYQSVSKLLASVMEWLYMTTITISPLIIEGFFNTICESSQIFYSKQMSLMMRELINRKQFQGLSKFLGSIPILFRRHYKKKPLECTYLAFQIIEVITPDLKGQTYGMKVLTEKREEVFVIPLLIDFFVKRIETLGDVPNQKLCDMSFVCLHLMVDLFPNVENTIYHGQEDICPDFSILFNRLIKYAIDEKDLELKEKYIQILRRLAQKTPVNFRIEYESSQSNNQHSRVALLLKLSKSEKENQQKN